MREVKERIARTSDGLIRIKSQPERAWSAVVIRWLTAWEMQMTAQTPVKPAQSAVHRSAISAFAPIQREFDRLFDRLADGWGDSPRMDIRNTDQGLEITVELPGIDRKDVKLAVEDGVLTISGEKKTETETREADYRLSERSYGSFSRSIALPSGVAADKIEASMRDGVLTLTAPRSDQTKPRTIEIQPSA